MKSIISLSSVILVALLFSLSSCADCIKGTGDRITVSREVDGFSKIVHDMGADVFITKGENFRLEIKGQENLIEEIETTVTGEILRIDTDKCFRGNTDIDIYITMPELESFELNGSGDIVGTGTFTPDQFKILLDGSGNIELDADANTAEIILNGSGDIESNLNTNSIDIELDGSGNIDVAGSTGNLTVELDGSGDIYAYDLTAENCEADLGGSGNIRVTVTNELDATLSGSGNIYYKGNPVTVNQSVTGSGDIAAK